MKKQNTLEWIQVMREAGSVNRCHTIKIIGTQDVAQHSYNVAMIIVALTDGDCSSTLLQAALTHDTPELWTGDIPAPTKWKYAHLEQALRRIEWEFKDEYDLHRDITKDELKLLKFADYLEFAFLMLEQRSLGNLGTTLRWNKVTEAIARRGYPNEACLNLHTEILNVWKDLEKGVVKS